MHEYGHYPDPYLPEIPPWLAKWFEDQSNPYPRDGRYNYYDPYAGQQVGPLEVPFDSVAAYRAQKNGMGAETPSHTVGRQVGANEYPSGAMLKFPSWMEGPPAQMSGRNYAQLLMSYINQGRTDGPPNPFSELKANPLMAQLLAAKAGRGPNPYLPSTQNYIPDKGVFQQKPIQPRPKQPKPNPQPSMPNGPSMPLPPKPDLPPSFGTPRTVPDANAAAKNAAAAAQQALPRKPAPKPKQVKPTLNSYIPRYERD